MALSTNSNLKTSSKITKASMSSLFAGLNVAQKCDWSSSEEFAKINAKIGSTLQIRREMNTTIIEGSMAFVANQPVDRTVALTIDQNYQVPLYFQDTDLALKVEMFVGRYIKPAMVTLATRLDGFVYNLIVKSTANTVGQYSTPLASSTILAANALLADYGCPDDGERYAVITPAQNASLANYQATLFNSSKEVSKIYETGYIGTFAGLKFAQSNVGQRRTDGTWTGSPVATISATYASTSAWAEDVTLSVNGFTAGATLNVGDVFTLSGVYGYNPQTGVVLSNLQQFVVTTAVGSAISAAQSVVVSPAIVNAGPNKNVEITVNGSVPLTKYSTSGTEGIEGIIWHKEAVKIASIELPDVIGSENKVEKDESGFIMNYARGSDILNRTNINRIDVVFGAKVARPEHVVRLRG